MITSELTAFDRFSVENIQHDMSAGPSIAARSRPHPRSKFLINWTKIDDGYTEPGFFKIWSKIYNKFRRKKCNKGVKNRLPRFSNDWLWAFWNGKFWKTLEASIWASFAPILCHYTYNTCCISSPRRGFSSAIVGEFSHKVVNFVRIVYYQFFRGARLAILYTDSLVKRRDVRVSCILYLMSTCILLEHSTKSNYLHRQIRRLKFGRRVPRSSNNTKFDVEEVGKRYAN